MTCARCHGSHFIRNPAWSDRPAVSSQQSAVSEEAGAAGPPLTADCWPLTAAEERDEAYSRTTPEAAAFAREHGPELLPCPDCAGDVTLAPKRFLPPRRATQTQPPHRARHRAPKGRKARKGGR